MPTLKSSRCHTTLGILPSKVPCIITCSCLCFKGWLHQLSIPFIIICLNSLTLLISKPHVNVFSLNFSRSDCSNWSAIHSSWQIWSYRNIRDHLPTQRPVEIILRSFYSFFKTHAFIRFHFEIKIPPELCTIVVVEKIKTGLYCRVESYGYPELRSVCKRFWKVKYSLNAP